MTLLRLGINGYMIYRVRVLWVWIIRCEWAVSWRWTTSTASCTCLLGVIGDLRAVKSSYRAIGWRTYGQTDVRSGLRGVLHCPGSDCCQYETVYLWLACKWPGLRSLNLICNLRGRTNGSLDSTIGRVSYLIYVSMRHYVLTTSGDIVVCFHTAVCLSC